MPLAEAEQQLLPTIGPPWVENDYGVKFCPVRVPVTSPTRYVSYQAALNLRLQGEHTGDWHQDDSFFTIVDNPHTLTLAGPGGWGDSTPSLGSKGVRDMAHILADWVIPPDCGPVWVANHYRAIADYVVLDTADGRCLRSPRYCPVYTINQWLDTEEQIEHLVEGVSQTARRAVRPGNASDPRRMATDRNIFLNPSQQLHESVMRAVLGQIQATPYVFKGGSALAFAYGLDRHSTDLDFDADGPVAIKDLVEAGLHDASVELADFIVGKDTDIGQRLKVHYTQPAMRTDVLLNIDLSFRETPNEDEVAVIDGIRTYRVTAIFDQKMRASVGRTRARDLYDLGFIADKYGDVLSAEQIRSADAYTRDYEGLADEYRQAFPHDKLLSGITTADDRALKFRIAIEEQLHRRGMQVIEQAVPVDRSLAAVLALHQIWLGSDGQLGERADLSGANFRGKVLIGLNFRKAILDRADFTEADLRNTDLREASLKSVNLEGANLLGANATGADMQGVKTKRTMLGGSTKGVGEAVARAYKERTASAPAKAPVRTIETPRRDDPELSWSR